MKKIYKYVPIVLLAYLLPRVVSAQARPKSIQDVLALILEVIELFLIPIILGLALLAFLWGVVKYIKGAGDSKARAEGSMFMLWGLIALAVMVSVWGLVSIIAGTFVDDFGLPNQLPGTVTP